MPDTPPQGPTLINRELSWLEFNARVLAEASDPRVPLLERLKFLAIFGTNLDEFYMVRVAGLRRQAAAQSATPSRDGLSARQQLDLIEARVRELLARVQHCLHVELLPQLATHGITIVSVADASPAERAALDSYFDAQLYPVLTPLAVDPEHPFPYISNLSLSLAVQLREPESGQARLARVKVPKSLPRWVPLAGRPHAFVPLEQLIGARLDSLFPGMQVIGWHAFRITRYSDLDLADAEETDDLLALIEEQVFRRRFGEVVRLEVEQAMPAETRRLLLDELRVTDEAESALALAEGDVDEFSSLLDLGDLMAIATLDVPALRDPPFVPAIPPELRDAEHSIFDVIRGGDLLVHHPYDAFGATVEEFIGEASRDEQVLAIKMTLYRISGDGAIVRALTEAAERGVQVAAVVELQARFEEVNNITWARTMESSGVQVSYGLPGLKTHAKMALVVRREADGIRRYVHVSTGNYNAKTARVYTDIGLFTCSEALGADVSDVFNMLTGFSRQKAYHEIIVAPTGMRERVIELIAREARFSREGKPARIAAKMNALVDRETIDALYDASQAGVEVDLLVRGICCLRPGVPGLSDRIRVVSVIGRFLEHSRVWHFANGGEPECFIASADWMPRNFNRRVEIAVPVRDAALRARLLGVLETALQDDRQAWDLAPDGTYTQRRPAGNAESDARASQSVFLRDSWGLASGQPRSRPADVFG
ncbi:MAG: polyphosphate kinase 1 [Gemmatimonadetes bacterium]|nr:polyphosphate kinase 1 [Gemmatimonadota bacterium]